MEKQLVKKLAEVMKEVKYIQKTGYNSFHKYKYATEADVNEKVREELSKHNIIMIPSVKSHATRTHTNQRGNMEYIVTVEVEFTFMDGDTGETISFTTFGEGQDAGDKGTYKAITGAQKYALMKAFMIPTGDDPEADTGVDERNARPSKEKPQEIEAPEPTEPTPALKAKYQLGRGSLEGFEDWVSKMKEQGVSFTQMEQILTEALAKKQKKGA